MLGELIVITNFYFVPSMQVLDALLCEYEKSVQAPGKWQKLSVFLQQRFVCRNCIYLFFLKLEF